MGIRAFLWIVCIYFLAIACKEEKEFSLPYEKYVLENGLEVVLHEDKSDPIVSVAIQYHVGSAKEKPGKTGFAHFFEHMLFQRSEHLGRNAFFKKIQELGGTCNGSTAMDGTNYYETVPRDALEKVLWMESDRMGFFINTVTQAGLEREIDVVSNEKRQGENCPFGQSYALMLKYFYPEGHPYSWPVIGSIADLRSATVEDVKEFYRTYYGPNNATLVVAGDLIKRLALEYRTPIIPVDSEHSAIFQCLVGEGDNPIEKIILTASGGPFRKFTAEQMAHVTKSDALKHPKWHMGHKITIDSATLMNKGFEMIEAKWLFDVSPQNIEIAVHPQSIVHSMVQFKDGSVKAQLGTQDMRLPIRYALSYPARLESSAPKLTLEQYSELTFEYPDFERFPLLRYAFDAVATGGNMPCIMNAANEIAVAGFLNDTIAYPDIARIVSETMEHIEFIESPEYEDYVHTNKLARNYATELVKSYQ